jgi:hypothetical protein
MARFARSSVAALQELLSMCIRVTIRAISKSRDMETGFAASIPDLRVRLMALVTFDGSVFSLERETCFGVFKSSFFNSPPIYSRVAQ